MGKWIQGFVCKYCKQNECYEKINLFEKSILTSQALILILTSFILFGFEIYMQYLIISNTFFERSSFFNGLKIIINNIGCTTLVVGIGSILLEYYGFVDYMRKRIKDVILHNDYLTQLSEDKRKELITRLEETIYFKEKSDPNSFFYMVKNQVSSLIDDYYYNEHLLISIALLMAIL